MYVCMYNASPLDSFHLLVHSVESGQRESSEVGS